MKKLINKLLLAIVTLTSSVAYAETVSFRYTATITQSSGANGLAIGDVVEGDFTYVLGQSGTNVSLIVPGFMTRYHNGVMTAKVQGQKVFSTGGQVQVQNDVEAFGSIVWDGVLIDVTDRFGSIKVGEINGFKVNEMQILLTNLEGQPFTSTALPTQLDLFYYPTSRRFLMSFEGNGGIVFAEINTLESCSINPEIPYLGCTTLN